MKIVINAPLLSRVPLSILQVMLLLVVASCLYGQQAMAADLGRLFSSPAERLKLDKLRRDNKPQSDSLDLKSADKKTKTMVYNGIVRRSNGEKQIWVNGKPVKGRKGPDGIQIYKDPDGRDRLTVTVPGKNKVVRVKPGQQWDLESGKIEDLNSTRSKNAVDTAKP